MALTKSFKDLVQSRVARDPDFAAALLREGIDAMLTGDVDTGKAILRDYIKATVGFEKLAEATDTPPKSLIRMFGPRGNPQARNLFSVIGYLQQQQASNCMWQRGHAEPSEGTATTKNDPHWGTTLDEFLGEAGIREAAKVEALTRAVAWQLSQEMERQGMTKAALAERMHTSRAEVDRILQAKGNITIQTLQRAAALVGRELRLELV